MQHRSICPTRVSAGLADRIASMKRGIVVQTALHTRATVDMRNFALRDITIRGELPYPPDSRPRVMDLVASARLPEWIITQPCRLSGR